MLSVRDIYIFIANLIGSDGWGFRVSQHRISYAPTERVACALSKSKAGHTTLHATSPVQSLDNRPAVPTSLFSGSEMQKIQKIKMQAGVRSPVTVKSLSVSCPDQLLGPLRPISRLVLVDLSLGVKRCRILPGLSAWSCTSTPPYL